ncbi:MAG: GNAT family N-acetyltransferase [Eubacteriales bacterium]|nr:GNAT family N-acetyltransferase [Eubacteriales bacterium]MDD3349953.1 GNAT family N-acetyltransferase [Eubacteriales bacterium]
MHSIKITEDYYPLAVLFQRCGLEVNPNDNKPEGIVKMWKCEDEETGELIGAATVQLLNGVYVVKHLAIDEEHRKTGIGKILLQLAEEELKNLGASEIWLSGKVPDYYLRFGWEKVQPEDAPSFSKCLKCSQFNQVCFPSIMKKLF